MITFFVLIVLIFFTFNSKCFWHVIAMLRSSRPGVFCKKGAFKHFAKLKGKLLCRSLFFHKVAGVLEKRFRYTLFPIKLEKYLRTVLLGAIQLLRSHSGGEEGEGGFLKMRTKANGGEGGGFLPSRTFAKEIFFFID